MRSGTLARLFTVTGLLLSAAGCVRQGSSAGAAAADATGKVSGEKVQLTGGVELAKVQNPDLVHAQFYLSSPDVDTPVIFGVVKSEGRVRDPVILKKVGPPPGTWRVVQVSADWCEWVHAAACPARGEAWGILDGAEAPRDDQLTLLRSLDGGITWTFFSAIRKVSTPAVFSGFSMGANGHGQVTMSLADDAGDKLHGYYHYQTTDGGKTWTGPTYEANDAVEASPIVGDQPLAAAIKAAEAQPTLGAGSEK